MQPCAKPRQPYAHCVLWPSRARADTLLSMPLSQRAPYTDPVACGTSAQRHLPLPCAFTGSGGAPAAAAASPAASSAGTDC